MRDKHLAKTANDELDLSATRTSRETSVSNVVWNEKNSYAEEKKTNSIGRF